MHINQRYEWLFYNFIASLRLLNIQTANFTWPKKTNFYAYKITSLVIKINRMKWYLLKCCLFIGRNNRSVWMEHFWNGWPSYNPWSLWCLIRNLTGFIFWRQHGHLWRPSLLLAQRLICLLIFVIPVLMIRFLYTFIKFWLFFKKRCVILIEKLLFIHVLKIYHWIEIELWLILVFDSFVHAQLHFWKVIKLYLDTFGIR